MQFDVVDTGIGLDAEQAARLFQPFSQADVSTSRRFGGTGLGLTISRRLAQLLGGELILQATAPGQGSTFRLVIAAGTREGVRMVADPARAAVTVPEAGSAPSEMPSLDCRVLLAEDGLDNQRLLTHILRKAGAETKVVDNGRAAVEAALAAVAAGRPFDVILMDMQMPVMDGYEAARRLRQEGYRRPIIALTAHAMTGDREKCLRAGCDDFATKPVDRRKFLETVRAYSQRGAATASA
jgi:CheY-like chemotaxis protein